MADFAAIRFQPSRPLLRELSADRLNSILAEIKRNKPLPGRGITVRQTGQGTAIDLAASTGRGGTSTPAEAHPFQISSRQDPDDENQYLVTVRPGTLNNVLASNWNAEETITDAPTYVGLQVGATSNKIASSTLIFETETIAGEATPVKWATPSTFKVLLGIVIETQVFQIVYNNLTYNAAKRITTDRSSPQAGLLPYDNWYTWVKTDG